MPLFFHQDVSSFIMIDVPNQTEKMRIVQGECAAYRAHLMTLEQDTATGIFQDTLAYIHQHFFEETCTVRKLRDDLGIRNHNFSGYFRAASGMGIKEYIMHHRLMLAKRLLQYPELSILQIALGVGFSSHEALTMAFKMREGCTPSCFRNQSLDKSA